MFKAEREKYARGLETLATWEIRKLEDLFVVTRPGSDELNLVRTELTERGEEVQADRPEAAVELRLPLHEAVG